MSYDYRNLSPIEFERLCSDLMSLKDDVRYQRFGEGKDDGIDLLYEDSVGRKTIVQCKRYREAATLINVLRKIERQKVLKLNPFRYYLITSASLSPGNKNEICDIFKPHLHTMQDVLGCQDLDDMLSTEKYKSVVYNVPALWLASFKLISPILNNGVLGRSQSDVMEYISQCRNFAWTSICEHGYEKLERKHSIILIGDPGGGKTVSAKMLVCKLRLQGFRPIISYGGIEDFEDVYEEGEKQVFFFDDFLGSNYFEAIEGREDSKTCQFIRRVARDDTKRFILTSRTTILSRGMECSLAYRAAHLNDKNCLVDVNAITQTDKAHILYKLLAASGCVNDVLSDFVQKKLYWSIIRHENFNPRIIDFILEQERRSHVRESTVLQSRIVTALKRPMEVWESVYNLQINPLERVLVWIALLEPEITESTLNEVHDRLIMRHSRELQKGGSWTFDQVMRTLVGSLLRRKRDGEKITYALLNHSIADFLVTNWSKDELSVKLSLEAIEDVAALESFLRFTASDDGSKAKVENVVRYLLESDQVSGHLGRTLKAYVYLIQNKVNVLRRAFDFVKTLNFDAVDGNGAVDDLVRIMISSECCGCCMNDLFGVLTHDDIDHLLNGCVVFENAAALYNMSIRYKNYEPRGASEVFNDLLVERAGEEVNVYWAPELEYNPGSGYMELTSSDKEYYETKVGEKLNELIADSKIPAELVDVDKCVELADIGDAFKQEPDCGNDEEDAPEMRMEDVEIDNMFAGLRTST